MDSFPSGSGWEKIGTVFPGKIDSEGEFETIRSLDIRVAGILRWTNHAEGDAIALDNKHREQERKLRDLITRVEALERGQRPQ